MCDAAYQQTQSISTDLPRTSFSSFAETAGQFQKFHGNSCLWFLDSGESNFPLHGMGIVYVCMYNYIYIYIYIHTHI